MPWVTRFFEEGHCHVLVGTRGLLGEGWDARAITGLVDLTTATTSTAVVQTRGRALRTDPYWPEKVALTWSVVCVSEDHPKGGNDWDRFVRKHEGFYGVDAEGDVVAGVAHVDADLLAVRAAAGRHDFDAVNARMLAALRAARRRSATPGRSARRTPTRSCTPSGSLPQHADASRCRCRRRSCCTATTCGVRDGRPAPWRPHLALAVGLVLAAARVPAQPHAGGRRSASGLVTMLGIQTTVAVDRGRRLAEDLARPPSIEQVAYAVADGLHDAGLSPVGADGGPRRGRHRRASGAARWRASPPAVSAAFATALDEVVSPMASPRYVLPRWVLQEPVDNADGIRAALGRLRPDGEVWHSVPTVLGTTGTAGAGVRGRVGPLGRGRAGDLHRQPGGRGRAGHAPRQRPVRGDDGAAHRWRWRSADVDAVHHPVLLDPHHDQPQPQVAALEVSGGRALLRRRPSAAWRSAPR